jgi:S1-C subfamily serine protease
MSAAHIFELNQRVVIATCSSGEKYGTVVLNDDDLDQALILADTPLTTHLKMRWEPIAADESVRAIGFPDRAPWQVSTGKVINPVKGSLMSVTMDRSGQKVIQHMTGTFIYTSVMSWNRGSGGPLVDADNLVIGIVTHRDSVALGALERTAPTHSRSVIDFCKKYKAHEVCTR